MRRPLSRDPTGTEVAFHNVNYSVKTKVKGKKGTKQILKEVNGVMRTGLNAILGPTGSGKTTLLDILAGRKDKRFLTGDVLINGERQPNNFKLVSGYVVQDDVVMGTLTVRENLLFSASLRLPKEFGKEDRKLRVEMILSDLGLSGVADSKVGTELIRGISGGERKRTNIGMELITSPDVLFLDEPTTGLDAATACTVMQLLEKQAKRGRTVICSIHQPRYSIYKLFDTLTLLSAGEIVYHGPNLQALPYFSDLGYICEQYNNPPDFFLDVIDEEAKLRKASKTVSEFTVLDTRETATTTDVRPSLADRYRISSYYKVTMDELKPTVESLYAREQAGTDAKTENSIGYQTSFFRQLGIVSKRALLNIIRNPQTGIAQIFVMLLYAVIIGTIYFQVDLGDSGLQNRVGVFFFLVMSMIFGNMSAVELFIKERRIFVHESANGYYRVSAYFIAKVLCDIIPMRMIPIILFSAVTYWMIGLRNDVFRFLFFGLNLLLTSLCAVGLSFAVSSSVSVFGIASLLTVLPYIFMMVFSGLLVNLKSIASWLRWIKYLSIFRYSLSNLDINELHGLNFHCSRNSTTCTPRGDDYLKGQGIEVDQLWYNILALGVMTIIFLTISYIQLRRMKKEK